MIHIGDTVEFIYDYKITHSNGIICPFAKGEKYIVIEIAEHKEHRLLGCKPAGEPSIAYLNHLSILRSGPYGYCFWIEENVVAAISHSSSVTA